LFAKLIPVLLLLTEEIGLNNNVEAIENAISQEIRHEFFFHA
jgi:hypothetical protein